jgi:hypothetical protein
MLSEKAYRKEEFVEETRVRMADGQDWFLPALLPSGIDLEHDAILAAIEESEDYSELLKSELALTIYLLSKNYRLSPSALSEILDFKDDPRGREACQTAVHAMVFAHAINHQYIACGSMPRSPYKSVPTASFLANCALRVRSILSL